MSALTVAARSTMVAAALLTTCLAGPAAHASEIPAPPNPVPFPILFSAKETAALAQGGAVCDAMMTAKHVSPRLCDARTRAGQPLTMIAKRAVPMRQCVVVERVIPTTWPFDYPWVVVDAAVVTCRS